MHHVNCGGDKDVDGIMPKLQRADYYTVSPMEDFISTVSLKFVYVALGCGAAAFLWMPVRDKSGDKPKLEPEEMYHVNCGDDKDVDGIMLKLQRADYYTVPPMEELLSKEKEEAGFCGDVKDFVVGRHGYGSIKFLGETDVRKLDLDSPVQFNHRELIIYMDKSQKPLVLDKASTSHLR